MTAAQKPEQGPPARDAGLTDTGKRALNEIRARNALVVAINNESWGSKVSPLQARAYAEYMRRFNLDIHEVDILGGKPRRNGQYYKRRIMEMAHAGLIEWVKDYHIGPDERLQALVEAKDEWAAAEHTMRLRERIRHAVPDDAQYAFVVVIKLRSLAEPLDGCKWYVPGRQKLGWSKTERNKREMVSADPVGDEHPIETVETRAWARVGKLVAAEIPELRAEEAAMSAAEGEVEHVVSRIAEDEERQAAEHAAVQPPRGVPLAITEGPAEVMPLAQRERLTVEADPYGGEPGEEPDYSEAPFPDELPARTRA